MDQGAVMDKVMIEINWWGRYQKIQFLMVMLPVFACGFHVLSIVFIGRNIDHRCANIDNLNVSVQIGNRLVPFEVIAQNTWDNVTVTYESCSVEVKNGTAHLWTTKCLNGYNYSEPTDRSIVSQWDLVCEREALSDFTQTILSLGQLAGALICTGLADIYGRKTTYMASHLILFVSAIAISFSPNFTVFIVLRFILGVMQQGTGLVSNVLILEILPTKRRALPSQVGSYVWPASLMLLCLCAYITKDLSWQYTELLLASLSFYVLFQWWILDESPRWLLANNRIKDVENLIEKAARINKIDPQKAKELLKDQSLFEHSSDSYLDVQTSPNGDKTAQNGFTTDSHKLQTPDANMRFSAFYRNKNVLIVTLLSCYMWFADSLTYYGLIMTSTSLTDDFYMGFFVNILVEMPAAVAFGVLINRIGRKNCITVFQIIGGVSLLISVILNNADFAANIPGKTWISLVISLIGKFGISVAFGTLFQYSPELYPTNLRNTGFGISSMAARIGGMVAPYSRTFERHVPWGPGAVFTLLCLIVPVLVRFLPETHGHQLPQTIAEMDEWLDRKGKKSKEKPTNQLRPIN
ncbi:hypothetical protein Btru_015622 [Bulinus truncatus]|nr:hypothetical protein Btru_015622 [Bulinus truncatus]